MTIITETKIQIAKENQLEIVGQPIGEQAESIKYLYYKFIDCGHSQNIDTNLVRLKKFKCRQCEHERLEAVARKQGLVLLERACKGTPGLYEFSDCGHTQRIGYDAVARGLFRCRTCYYADETVDSRRQDQAAEQGLSLIGNTEEPAIGVYKRLSCGHVFNYQHSAIKSANKGKYQVGCKDCFEDDIVACLSEHNAKFVKKDNHKTEYLYSCGHKNSQDTCQIKKAGITPCRICFRENVIAKAKLLKLRATDSVNSYGKGTYEFTDCGHEVTLDNRSILSANKLKCKTCNVDSTVQYLSNYNVTVSEKIVVNGRNKFVGVFDACGHSRIFDPAFLARRPEGSRLVCTSCRDMKHEEESNNQGLTIVGAASNGNPNYRSFKMRCCGTNQDMELTHVRRGHFVCHNCEQTKYHKPTSVYLFKISADGRDWLKLGTAINVDYRATQYGLPDDAQISLVYSKEFIDGYTAVTIEKAMHRYFKSNRMPPEQMKELQMKSGFTECYPTELEGSILLKIKDEEWQSKL